MKPDKAWLEGLRKEHGALFDLHGSSPPMAAALLKGAALDLPHGKARQAMRELAGLLTEERAWLRMYAEGGVVAAESDEEAAGFSMSKVERYEALWGACKAEAEGVLAAFLPGKA